MRITLNFEDFDQVAQEIRLLQTRGYQRDGNWTLGQICDHLAIFVRGSMDGFATQMPWVLQATFGRWIARRILKTRKISPGWKVPNVFRPGPPGDDASSIAALMEVTKRYQKHTGPLQPSPFAGKLSREEWTQLHLIHAAHHLSFLRPRG